MTSAVSDLPDSGVTDSGVLERHRRFIESVAKEMQSSVQDIEPLYAEVIEALSAKARVLDYLPIFAYRRVREICLPGSALLASPPIPLRRPAVLSPLRARKVLILSVSAGAGHMRAAEAIRAHALAHDTAVNAVHLDVMDFASGGFRKLYTDFYISLVHRRPSLWGHIYRLTDNAQPDGSLQRLRRVVERLNVRGLMEEISAFQPDAIICTHFLPAEILAGWTRAGRLACPVWVQVTDFDLHRMWVHDYIAGYFAPSDEVAFRMRARGVPAHSIHVTGIPVMPAFRHTPDRAKCADELGIDPKRRTVLLMGGGAGLGRLDEVAVRLLQLEHDFQLIVLAGRNTEVLLALQRLAIRHPGRLLPHGYTDRIECLMACADLVVTKPGGLTVAECLAMGLPMIVNSPIPGQEERNADYLLEQGVALKANDSVTLEYRLLQLLADPARLRDMRARALALGRPGAGRTVIDTILNHSSH